MHIKVKKGLTIPIQGKPQVFKGEIFPTSKMALDLKPLPPLRLKAFIKEGEKVLKGQPLLEDKEIENRIFISPASGKVIEIIRGYKRAIETVVIEKDSNEEYKYHSFDLSSKDKILCFLTETGLLSNIQMRPFASIARHDLPPKKIFVRALETTPFVPPSHLQVEGMQRYFERGLSLLSELVDENLHLVYGQDETEKAFTEAKNVSKHTVSGPHPASLSSIHIHHIDPIKSIEDVAWVMGVWEVISIGYLIEEKKHYLQRVCSIAGALPQEMIGFYKVPVGMSIKDLLSKVSLDDSYRIISGDPLMGKEVSLDGFLGFFHTSLTVLKEEEKRKPLHFLGLGSKRYTATRAYASYWFRKKEYSFSSKLHGEPRPYVNPEIYDKFLPMQIPTVMLIKALIAEDFETAVELGLLEVAPEDFALATFICPSKIEMVAIAEEKLKKFYEMSHF